MQEPERNNRTVFIVDNDLAILDSLGIFFIPSLALKLTVKTFSSAIDFLRYLESHEIPETSCLIVDEKMPEMSGTELIEFLIDQGKPIPFIMTSGHGGDSLRLRVNQLGAVAFLAKPCQPSLLKEILERVFKS